MRKNDNPIGLDCQRLLHEAKEGPCRAAGPARLEDLSVSVSKERSVAEA